MSSVGIPWCRYSLWLFGLYHNETPTFLHVWNYVSPPYIISEPSRAAGWIHPQAALVNLVFNYNRPSKLKGTPYSTIIIMKTTKVQNPRRRGIAQVSEVSSIALCSLSRSCLCNVCSIVSEALVVSLRSLSLLRRAEIWSYVSAALVLCLRSLSCSVLANFSCSVSKVLRRFIASFLAIHCAFLFDGKRSNHIPHISG